MIKSLRLYASNALNSRANTIVGVSNTANVKVYSRRNATFVTNTVTSVNGTFDSYCAPDSVKYTFNVSFSTSLSKLFGFSIGPNSLSGHGGYVAAFKINSASSGDAGTYKGQPVSYNTIFVIPPAVVANGELSSVSVGWEPYSVVTTESAGKVKAHKFLNPGFPVVFDGHIANVTSIDVYLAQSGSLIPEYTFFEYTFPYVPIVGVSPLGIYEELFDNAPSMDPTIVASNSDLILSYISIFDESEESSVEATRFGTLLNLTPRPGKAVSMTFGNSSSTFEVGGFTAQKDPARSRLTFKVPLSLVDYKQVARLEQLLVNNAIVVLVLFESRQGMTNLTTERDLSRYVRILSPIQKDGVAEGYYNITLTLEEI